MSDDGSNEVNVLHMVILSATPFLRLSGNVLSQLYTL